MVTRRSFISKSSLVLTGLSIVKYSQAFNYFQEGENIPVVVSTWNYGSAANEVAWKVLSNGGYSLDAVEAGVRVPEEDPDIMVGFGSIPNAKGKVALDASIMDEKGRAGGVTCLQHIKHPISVARLILEKTSYTILSGNGALKYALKNGFKKGNLLTAERKSEWKKEIRGSNTQVNFENQSKAIQNSFGMLAVDNEGRISGACSSGGIVYKLPGRVGDSSIFGAGLFVDGKVGGAVATGTSELVMKTLGTFLVVEMMRNGKSPTQACEEAIKRISNKIPDYQNHQVGFLALNTNGDYGAYSIQPRFNFAVNSKNYNSIKESESWMKTL